MESMFEEHGLMDIVNGHVSVVSGTDPETAAILTKKKAKALSAINKNLDPSLLHVVMTFRGDLSGAWKALKDEFAGSTSQSIATLLLKLNGRS